MHVRYACIFDCPHNPRRVVPVTFGWRRIIFPTGRPSSENATHQSASSSRLCGEPRESRHDEIGNQNGPMSSVSFADPQSTLLFAKSSNRTKWYRFKNVWRTIDASANIDCIFPPKCPPPDFATRRPWIAKCGMPSLVIWKVTLRSCCRPLRRCVSRLSRPWLFGPAAADQSCPLTQRVACALILHGRGHFFFLRMLQMRCGAAVAQRPFTGTVETRETVDRSSFVAIRQSHLKLDEYLARRGGNSASLVKLLGNSMKAESWEPSEFEPVHQNSAKLVANQVATRSTRLDSVKLGSKTSYHSDNIRFELDKRRISAKKRTCIRLGPRKTFNLSS